MSPTIARGEGPYWATSVRSMAAIAAVDPDVAHRAFGNGSGIALGPSPEWPGAIPGQAWASLSTFEADLRSGAIDRSVRVVMYDPERWVHTPPAEQRDPVSTIRRFVRLAGAVGYVSMVTPYPRLVTVPGGRLSVRPGETEEEAYLRHRVAAEAGAADVVETQAQRSQRDPGAYRSFVAATVEQAREVNDDVVALSGLSTSPGYRATPRMLLEAWESVRDVVDGHYISLSKGRFPDVMTEFLGMALDAIGR
jgi:hypothetical protein